MERLLLGARGGMVDTLLWLAVRAAMLGERPAVTQHLAAARAGASREHPVRQEVLLLLERALADPPLSLPPAGALLASRVRLALRLIASHAGGPPSWCGGLRV